MKIIFASICDYQVLHDAKNIPLGLISLATVVKRNSSHEAIVVDFNRLYKKEFKMSESLMDNINRDAKYLLSKEPGVISIYTMCSTFHIALLLAEEIKRENAKVKVLLGGPQATSVAEKTLKKYSFLDGIGLGEGENTILGILDGLEKEDLSGANGIAYQDKETIIVRYNEILIQDLDELPILDLSLYPYVISDNISMDIGRGCPYSCIFCSTKLFWKRKFRIKSAKRIFEEILYFKDNYGISKFNFEHDLFVANRKLVLELCDMLLQKKVDIAWACSARVDTVDDELLREMKRAGCKDIYFGIETGSQKTQYYIKKNLDLRQVEELPALLIKHGLKATFSFIYGFPEETREDIDESITFIYKLMDRYHPMVTKEELDFQLHKLMFLPNTELTKRHMNELEHIKGYTMEIFPGMDRWNNKKLEEMVSDVELFPFLSCIKNSSLYQIQNLDKFFTYVFIPSLSLFDVTYKFLLEEVDGSLLTVYDMFSSIIEKEELSHFYGDYLKEVDPESPRGETVIKMLEQIIECYNFVNIDRSAIQNMYRFERDIYYLLYKSKEAKVEINVKKNYQYDVIKMRKNRNISLEKNDITVRFYTDNGKYIMKKIESKTGWYALIHSDIQSAMQSSLSSS